MNYVVFSMQYMTGKRCFYANWQKTCKKTNIITNAKYTGQDNCAFAFITTVI